MKNQPKATASSAQNRLLQNRAALVLLFIAVGLTVSVLPQQKLLAACAGGSGCAQIIGGHWSYWLAVLPVQWAGLAMYLALIATLVWKNLLHPAGRRTVQVLCGAVIGAGWWFSFVQAVVLKQFCPLCCSIHLCAGVAASILLLRLPGDGLSFSRRHRPAFFGALAAMMLLLVGSPWGVPAKSMAQSVALAPSSPPLVEKLPGGDLALLAGTSHLPSATLPRLGSADASHIAVMLMNHDCPHCVRQLKALEEVMQDLAAQDLAIYFVPVGTDPANAEAQATLLALWAGDPAVHNEVVKDLTAKRISLKAEAIRQAAASYATSAQVTGWLAEASLQRSRDQMVKHGQLIKAASETKGFKGLPQLWFPNGAELGSAEETSFYYQTVARHFGIQRKAEPRLILENKVITLGRTPAAGQTQSTIQVKNEGAGELIISGLKLPAGWKALTAFPKRVAQGQSDVLQLQIQSPAQPGAWNAQVHLLTNSAATVPPVVYQGDAVAPLAPGTERITLSDIAEGGRLTSEEHRLESAPEFELGSASFEMPGFTATQTRVTPAQFRFEQKEALPVGGYLGTLRVQAQWAHSTPAWTVPALELAVSAHVRAAVIVTPQRVVLSPLIQPAAQAYTIAMRPRDGQEKLIPKVELPPALVAAGVSATVSPADERQGVEITLHLPPQFNPAPHIGSQIVLRSGLAKAGDFNLPIEFAGRRPRPSFALHQPH